MPFCPNCGANNTGAFCTNCGTPISAPPSGGPAYQAPPPPGAQGAGMSENMAGALCYLLGLITGVIFLAMAPYNANPRIRFHAWQSILLNLAWIGVWIVLTVVAAIIHILAIGFMLMPLVSLCFFVLWLFLMFKAYSNEMFELPVIGPIAKKQAGL